MLHTWFGEGVTMSELRQEPLVLDEDIERIAEQAEAGIAALLAAYEPYEQQYFAVAGLMEQGVIYAAGTSQPA